MVRDPHYVYKILSEEHTVVWLGDGMCKGAYWHHRFLQNGKSVPLRLQRKEFSISFNAIDESMIKEMTTKPDYRDGRRESGKLVVKE